MSLLISICKTPFLYDELNCYVFYLIDKQILSDSINFVFCTLKLSRMCIILMIIHLQV